MRVVRLCIELLAIAKLCALLTYVLFDSWMVYAPVCRLQLQRLVCSVVVG